MVFTFDTIVILLVLDRNR